MWLGKHIIELEKILETKKKINIYDFKRILLSDEIYLTLEEIVFNISKTYFETIDDTITTEYTCNKCFEKNNCYLTIDDFKFIHRDFNGFLSLKEHDLVFEVERPCENFKFIENILENIITNNMSEKIMNSFFYNEMIYSIKNVIKNGENLILSIDEINDLLLNTNIKNYKKIIDEFNHVIKPDLTIEKTCNCSFCENIEVVKFNNKELPKHIVDFLI